MSRARWLARELAPPLTGIVGAIAVWAIVAAATDSAAIPSPLLVWDAFVAGMRDGTIPEAAIKTLIRLTFSFVVAVVFGVALGLGLAFNEFARRAIRPLVVALQITPFVAWVPLAVIWFGVTERAVVFVAIVGSFPAMTLATLQAIRQVPPLYERAGRTLGAGGWALYRKIIFPAALPGRDGRPAAGLGLRVEGADGRGADRDGGVGHRARAPARPARNGRADAARGAGRHPRDRCRRRLPLVRPARPPDPAAARPPDRVLSERATR